MMLYFRAKAEELRMSYLSLMEVAHFWKFERAVIPQEDYVQFLLHGVLPPYVVEFLKDVQKQEIERCNKSTAPSAARPSQQMQWSNSALPSVLEKR